MTAPQRVLAIAGAWLALIVGLLAGGDVGNLLSLIVAGGMGAALVLLGFAAAWTCRPLPPHEAARSAQLVLLAVIAGAALGVANLAANWAIAQADPRIHELLAQRMAAIGWLGSVVVAPPLEEVALRLFLMSAIAWIASRFTDRRRLAFGIALVGSAFIFALLHLARPLPADSMAAFSYRAALLAKYMLAGVSLGWVFWRWGLPYAILCHAAANAVHRALQTLVL